MFWMRADKCAAALPVLHSAHCSGEPRRPYQLLKRPVGRLPIPDTQRRPTRSFVEATDSGTPKRVDCLGYFFVAGQRFGGSIPWCVFCSTHEWCPALYGDDTRALQHYMGHKNIMHTVRYTEDGT